MSTTEPLSDLTGLEVAVIGMAGRFPGAPTLDTFWQNLRDGVESITFFSDDELFAAGIDPRLLRNPQYVKANGILDHIDRFDAAFFGFSPREADLIDPQHRLFLECVWEALENAGYDPHRFPGAIGVFAGVGASTYGASNQQFTAEAVGTAGYYQTMIGVLADFLATRISYKFNLHGPSMTIQTACSTSLVAVHLACQSLLSGDSDIALAGGVSIQFPHKSGYFYQPGGVTSPDGHCRAFDAHAQGTIRGSGAGVVVLKRLENALPDGDNILAVIKGSAINNDGARKVGYTAPSVEGQARVIRAAQQIAEVEPETIGYIEAHGPGTPIGDPIEIAALRQAFQGQTQQHNSCAIGSVKTNIGHLDTAAGVAGLIKTVLALTHRQIPPSLHFEQLNPAIDLGHSPFRINSTLTDWPDGVTPRRAGVSAFGIGGTNAHVILEEAPPRAAHDEARAWKLLTLSARTSSALDYATANMAAHLRHHPESNLADVAYTLQVGRHMFKHRRIVLCRELDDAVTSLETRDPQQMLTATHEGPDRPIVFMFPGGGTQHVDMARELYQSEPIFREQIDHCAEVLMPHLILDLRCVLYPGEEQAEEVAAQLRRTSLALPALFAIEYALAKLWMSYGVRPQAMIGHSLGEYVAACLAGVISLEEALATVVLRGQLIEQVPPGAMLSIPLPEHELIPFMNDRLSLAVINGPSACVVSGPIDAIESLAGSLTAMGVDFRQLQIAAAGHSSLMNPILDPFTRFVATLRLQPPKIPYISNVSGTWITAAEATDPHYWARHLRQTVRFGDGVRELLQEPDRLFLEVGPGHTLSTLVKRHPDRTARQAVFLSLPAPTDPRPEGQVLLMTLGQLWLAGAAVNWSEMYAHERRQRVPLPTYPFERQRHWIATPNTTQAMQQATAQARLDIADWFSVPSWKRSPLSAPRERAEQLPQQSWLVFLDACGLGAQVAYQLRRLRQEVITVQAGQQFVQIDDHAYELDPRRRADYLALIDALQLRDAFPTTILHLWGIASDAPAQSAGDHAGSAQDLSFSSLLFLAQALGERREATPVRMGVVSNAVQEVSGDEPLRPAQAPAIGLCKVVPRAYPALSCRSIDVVLPQGRRLLLDQLADQVIAEFMSPSSDQTIALRGKYRWVQTFAPLVLDRAEEPPLRSGGVYVIVGASGAIASALAVDLARAAQANVILVAPEALAALAQCDQSEGVGVQPWDAQVPQASGTALLGIDADVADRDQLQSAIDQVAARFGRIHGVIHLAGYPGTATTQGFKELERAGCARQCASAIEQLAALEQSVRSVELDFCVILSSLEALVGELDYVAAAAVHGVIQTFSLRHNQSGAAPWTDLIWEGEPLAAPGHAIEPGATHARPAMTMEEGLDAFQRVLSSGAAGQVVVSTGDLQTRLAYGMPRPEEAPAAPPTAPPDALHARPMVSTAYVAPRNEHEQTLARIWQAALGVESIGALDNFFELGGDSLLAIQVIAQMRDAFHVDLAPHSLLHQPTIAALAATIGGTSAGAEHRATPARQLHPSLVNLQPDGRKTPLFLVHPIGGGVYIYRELAHLLGPDQPVYGLQAQGFDGKAEPLTRVEDMAARYIEAISAVQPEGPYLVGGSSFGGVVAFEIAQRLRAREQEVALLTLIDSPTPGQLPTQPPDEYEILATLLGRERAELMEQLGQRPPEEHLRDCLEQARAAGNVPPEFGMAEFRRFLGMLKGNFEALHCYIPRVYPGAAILFRATVSSQQVPAEIEQSWRALVAGGLEVHVVPGNHFTMNYTPNVQVMAEWLGKYLG